MRRAAIERSAGVAVSAAALLYLLLGAWRVDHVPYLVVAVWAVLAGVMELAPIRLPGGGRLTVTPVLDFAGVLLFGPVVTAWVTLFGTIGAGALERVRERPRAIALRSAVTILAIATAGVIWGALGSPSLRVPRDLPALLAMGGAYTLVAWVGQALISARRHGRMPVAVLRANARWSVISFAAFLPLGIVAALLYQELHLFGVLLFISPILLARHAFRLYTETRTDVFDFVETLTEVIEQVDPYTRHHSTRVAAYARQIAVEMNLREREIELVATAGLLHDLGKVSFKTADIMESPAPLTDEQRMRMVRHPSIGADIVARVRMFREVSELVRYHHERVDGGGYPYGLAGDAIPLGSRILTVADTFDAMTSDRAYRRALRLDEALGELRRHAGAQFDPRVVAAVERLVARGELRVLYDASENAAEAPPAPVAVH